jgi:hypothetical protein
MPRTTVTMSCPRRIIAPVKAEVYADEDVQYSDVENVRTDFSLGYKGLMATHVSDQVSTCYFTLKHIIFHAPCNLAISVSGNLGPTHVRISIQCLLTFLDGFNYG